MCGSSQPKAFTKSAMPYVTFNFTDSTGISHVGRGAIGAVGFSREGHVGDKFDIMVDPKNPKQVEEPIGWRYFSFTFILGNVGLSLLIFAYISGKWTRRLAGSVNSRFARQS
jgi:hypothetical protein